MCVGCPDFVDACWEGGCRGPDTLPDGQPKRWGRSRKFFLGDTLCEHLAARYGTSDATEYDQRRREELAASDD